MLIEPALSRQYGYSSLRFSTQEASPLDPSHRCANRPDLLPFPSRVEPLDPATSSIVGSLVALAGFPSRFAPVLFALHPVRPFVVPNLGFETTSPIDGKVVGKDATYAPGRDLSGAHARFAVVHRSSQSTTPQVPLGHPGHHPQQQGTDGKGEVLGRRAEKSCRGDHERDWASGLAGHQG